MYIIYIYIHTLVPSETSAVVRLICFEARQMKTTTMTSSTPRKMAVHLYMSVMLASTCECRKCEKINNESPSKKPKKT